jgi:hypothetical protein
VNWLALSDLARKEREEKAHARRERASARSRRKEQQSEGDAPALTLFDLLAQANEADASIQGETEPVVQIQFAW